MTVKKFCEHVKQCYCVLPSGLAVNQGETELGLDNKPFTSLLYGNGPGFQGVDTTLLESHSRQNLTNVNTG